MSKEQLEAFLEKVKADTSLQEKLKAEGADQIAIAEAAGFAITTEDLKTNSQNLSDDQLVNVTGGDVTRVARPQKDAGPIDEWLRKELGI